MNKNNTEEKPLWTTGRQQVIEKIDCCTVNNLDSVACIHYLLVKISWLLCPEVYCTYSVYSRMLKSTKSGDVINLLFDINCPLVFRKYFWREPNLVKLACNKL